MNLLSKSTILSANDLKTIDVDVPEWGGVVRVRAMSAAARENLESVARTDQNAIYNRARLAAFSLVDEAGDLLFSEEEIDQLANKSVAALDRVIEVVLRINDLEADRV